MTEVEKPDSSETSTVGSGSPTPGGSTYLVVGKLRKAHGVRGEITMEVLTDFPERLRPRRQVFVGEEHRPLRITSVRWKDQLMLIAFDQYDDCDKVNVFRNQLVYTQAEKLPDLQKGEYYFHQLLGLLVKDESGNNLGRLDEILETGANDVYVVKNDEGGEFLLPVIDEVILQVKLEEGEIIVRPPLWE